MEAGTTASFAVLDELPATPTDLRWRGRRSKERMAHRKLPFLGFEFEREELLVGRLGKQIEFPAPAREPLPFSLSRSASPHVHSVALAGGSRR